MAEVPLLLVRVEGSYDNPASKDHLILAPQQPGDPQPATWQGFYNHPDNGRVGVNTYDPGNDVVAVYVAGEPLNEGYAVLYGLEVGFS